MYAPTITSGSMLTITLKNEEKQISVNVSHSIHTVYLHALLT